MIGERVRTHKSWLVWTKRALQSTYGYDWQGDNVLLARKNVLFTVMEHYAYKYEKELAKTYIIEFAKIISWNIWQMDGLKYVIPNSCCTKEIIDEDLFERRIIAKICIAKILS